MNTLQLCSRHLRRTTRLSLRTLCTTAEPKLEVPTPDGEKKVYPPHITDIVSRISKLTLVEVADLNSCLKETLNIQDAPMMAMPMGGMAAAATPVEEETTEVKEVQSLFTVKLDKYDEAKKIPLIKEVKKLVEGMNLVQAKKFVESTPVVVKEDLTKDEAEAMKKALEEAGASVVIS